MNDQMNIKSMVSSLMNGIRIENDGHQFYSLAAEKTSDPKGKDTFRTLAKEELVHKIFLEDQLKSVHEKGNIDASLDLGQGETFSEKDPIFSPGILNRIGDAQFEMSALSIGITLELSSIDYYTEQADKAPIEEMRAFYKKLADWESVHYHALLRQQDLLKEDYWAAGGFAPF